MYNKVTAHIIVILNTFLIEIDGYYDSPNSIRLKLVNTKSTPLYRMIDKPEKDESNYEEVKLIINKFKSKYKYDDAPTTTTTTTTTSTTSTTSPPIDGDDSVNRFIDFDDDSDNDSSEESKKVEPQVKRSTTTESSYVDMLVGDVIGDKSEEGEDDDEEEQEEDEDDDEDEDEEEEEEEEDDEKNSKDQNLRQNRKKYVKAHKLIFPLLLAYKLKFFTMVPLLVGALVLLVGTTGVAGFFFALFAAAMGLHVKTHK